MGNTAHSVNIMSMVFIEIQYEARLDAGKKKGRQMKKEEGADEAEKRSVLDAGETE